VSSRVPPQRVKVEDASYDKASDTVSWTVTLESSKKADLVWRREDFGPAFKINAFIPTTLVEEFCQNMIGKDINLVVEEKPQEAETELNVEFRNLDKTIAQNRMD